MMSEQPATGLRHADAGVGMAHGDNDIAGGR